MTSLSASSIELLSSGWLGGREPEAVDRGGSVCTRCPTGTAVSVDAERDAVGSGDGEAVDLCEGWEIEKRPLP